MGPIQRFLFDRHERRDGATRKSRDTALVCRSNKNAVPRVLKHSDIRRRAEVVLMHVLAGALLPAFPDGTLRDAARFVMKAYATGGSLTWPNIRKIRVIREAGKTIEREAVAGPQALGAKAKQTLTLDGPGHFRIEFEGDKL